MSPLHLPCLLLAAFLAGCVAPPPPDSATACAVVELASVPLQVERNQPFVTVAVDGKPATLLLDTGAENTMVSEAAVARLGLRTDWGRLTQSTGVGGAVVHYGVTAERLDIGALHLADQSVGVVPALHLNPKTVVPDGYLGANILSQDDADIDFGRRRLTLYRARNCPSGGPPWAMPYATLPIRYVARPHNQMAVDVELAGKTLAATVDTGAQVSVVSRRTGLGLLGVDLAELDRESAGHATGIGPSAVVAHVRAFPDVRIAGEALGRVRLAVIALPEGLGDMLLGADYLGTHRIYVSYATGRLFVARHAPGAAAAP